MPATTHLQRVLATRPVTPAPTAAVVMFSRDELDLIVALACSLDASPGTNWVQRAGGLPDYICRIARAVKRTGKTTSQAIAIAVSRVKKWATGAGVDASTQAKAARALTQWEALRAKSKTRNRVAATRTGDVLCLAAGSYNVDIVRKAFETRQREARRAWRAANPASAYDDGPPHVWVREQWTNFLIVEGPGYQDAPLHKIPYTVDDKQEVTFGDPVEVKTEYVVVAEDDLAGADLSDEALQKLLDLTDAPTSGADRVLSLTAGDTTALDRVVNLAKEYAHTDASMYADPGYQSDKKKRYALDTAAQCRAAWSYINKRANAAKYSPEQVARIKSRIKAAAARHRVTISDD